jgi:ABC-type transporter MlaC component
LGLFPAGGQSLATDQSCGAITTTLGDKFFTLTTRLKPYSLYNLAHSGLRVGALWKEPHLNYAKLLSSCLLATVLCIVAGFGLAEQQSPAPSPKAKVEQQFTPLFDEVSLQLSASKQRYLGDPMAYQEFIDRSLRPLWDASSTARALVGRKHFESLTQPPQEALVEAVRDTLMRYAFEGLENYSGQQFRVIDVVINPQATMGWVQVQMESTLIPDIVLDVLIKQTDRQQGNWQAVDVRFKGITYVSVKKHQFRETIEEQGIDSLITDLQSKNREYFADICTQTKSSGRAPCAPSAE